VNQSLSRLRNRLLTGRERNPFGRRYVVRRCDVHPCLKVLVWIHTPLTDEMPIIWKDSQLTDAIAHPEKYQWFGKGSVSIGTIRGISLIFRSEPILKDDHWTAVAIDNEGTESEYALFSLGIVPDYIFKPSRDNFEPAGWNSLCYSQFNN
jgi:hypothetical protein